MISSTFFLKSSKSEGEILCFISVFNNVKFESLLYSLFMEKMSFLECFSSLFTHLTLYKTEIHIKHKKRNLNCNIILMFDLFKLYVSND